MGEVAVPADRDWGAQTQRFLQNFWIGGERMPVPLVRALGLVKQAAAETNMRLGVLDRKLGTAIARAAAEVVEGLLDDHFPLVVWQTGSGTPSNRNANEVIAGRANGLPAGKRGGKSPVPLDTLRQSSHIVPIVAGSAGGSVFDIVDRSSMQVSPRQGGAVRRRPAALLRPGRRVEQSFGGPPRPAAGNDLRWAWGPSAEPQARLPGGGPPPGSR
jgi:hypothetical protein